MSTARGTAHFDFSGCVAVVTGGAQGIGRAICDAFANSGATAVSWDLTDEPVVSDRRAGYRVDVSKPDTIAHATRATLERFGRIDLLVNNAGFAGPTEPLEHTDPDMWARVIDVNLLGVYHTCRSVVPVMRSAGVGRIVNIASLAGKEGTPNASAYSAAKAGVIALTKSLGKELARSGVLVNAIAPAAIETPLLQQMSAEHVQTMIAKSPLARLGTVDEVASLVLWLCSAACTFNTGAIFDLSGGRATY